MEPLEGIQALYEAYWEKTKQLERDRKPGQGLLGFGSGPKDDPCHDRFAQDAEAFLKDLETAPPDQIRDVLAFVYHTPLDHPEPLTAYWMMRAVHGLTLPLIGRLTAEDALALKEVYERDYPRRDRFPAQKKVLSALTRAAKG